MSLTRLLATLLVANLLAAQVRAEHAPSQIRACAAYDHHVTMLIEDLGIAREADSDVLAGAAMTVQEARAACRAGEYARAFLIYETVPLHRPRMTSFYRVLP
jgi:hypothetical protein